MCSGSDEVVTWGQGKTTLLGDCSPEDTVLLRASLHSNIERNDNRNRAVIPFDFNGAKIRVIQDEQGEPWFIAVDVAKTLGYVKPNDAVRQHCKKPKDFNPRESRGSGITKPKIIPESDVYRLVMRSIQA